MDTDLPVATHAPLGLWDSSQFSVQAVKRLTSCQSCGQVPERSELTVCSVSFHSQIQLWQGVACQTLMRSVSTSDLDGVCFTQDTQTCWECQLNFTEKHRSPLHSIPAAWANRELDDPFLCRARRYGPEWGASCDAWLSHLNERPADMGTLSDNWCPCLNGHREWPAANGKEVWTQGQKESELAAGWLRREITGCQV